MMEDVIDESVAMQALHPAIFDDFLAEGWRLLGHSIIRHNIAVCRGRMCRTVPLRIRLADFRFSKSQRKLLRHNAGLPHQFGPIRLNAEHERIFQAHNVRFDERRPEFLHTFIGPQAHREPVKGLQCQLLAPDRQTVAFSFMHLGQEGVSGTYCFFDPTYAALSPGSYTMLLELAEAQKRGFRYYYPGYCYDVPSQFDYKLNFEALEAFDWKTGLWMPRERLPVRPWREFQGT